MTAQPEIDLFTEPPVMAEIRAEEEQMTKMTESHAIPKTLNSARIALNQTMDGEKADPLAASELLAAYFNKLQFAKAENARKKEKKIEDYVNAELAKMKSYVEAVKAAYLTFIGQLQNRKASLKAQTDAINKAYTRYDDGYKDFISIANTLIPK